MPDALRIVFCGHFLRNDGASANFNCRDERIFHLNHVQRVTLVKKTKYILPIFVTSVRAATLLHIIELVYYAASSTSLSHAHLNSVSFQHARPIFREITFRRSRQNTLYSQERTNSSTSDMHVVCNFPHRALSRAKNYTSASRGI
jgi:hypothetical protein